MEANDLLNLKTTNINVRISPMLKSKLIEHGAELGINLSDFIGYVLTKDMSGQNDPTLSEEYKELIRKFQRPKEKEEETPPPPPTTPISNNPPNTFRNV